MLQKDVYKRAGTRAFPRVEIEWDDARVKGGWRPLEEYRQQGLAPCTAIGYQIKRDWKVVVLVQQLGLANDVSDAVVIPRACIRRVRRLKAK